MMVKEKQIGQMLVDANVITQDQLNIALNEQKRSRRRLGRILVELGFVSDVTLMEFLSIQIGRLVEECEKRYPEVFQDEEYVPKIMKQISVMSYEPPRLVFSRVELEQKAGKRLNAGERRLKVARECFDKGEYDEVFMNAYSAIHHIAQAGKYIAHQLELKEHEMVGMKFVYTGRTGIGQVYRIPTISEKFHPRIVKNATKLKAQQILTTAQNYFVKVKNAFEKEMLKYDTKHQHM